MYFISYDKFLLCYLQDLSVQPFHPSMWSRKILVVSWEAIDLIISFMSRFESDDVDPSLFIKESHWRAISSHSTNIKKPYHNVLSKRGRLILQWTNKRSEWWKRTFGVSHRFVHCMYYRSNRYNRNHLWLLK